MAEATLAKQTSSRDVHSPKKLSVENPKLVQHVFEQSHRARWDKAKILEIEIKSKYRKHKESVHMPSLNIPISKPS
jgi:hypothetical protein